MRYGLPYKGSKNAIAEWVVSVLPAGECLVDLFCGGGAITHAALLSGKWERFVMNDIDGRLPILFRDCVYGKYTTKTRPEWIDRATFKAKKDEDAYIALVWSFGNNGKDYLYSAEIEPFKQAYHKLLFENDPEPIRAFGYNIELSHSNDIIKRYRVYKSQIRKQTKRKYGKHDYDLDSFVRQENLERLQTLERHYIEANIPDNAVIYCDIPYSDTNCGKYDNFDHRQFYKWALEQDNIFISEYSMPEPFIVIASTQKSILSSAKGDCGKVTEKIFTNPKTYSRYDGIICDKQLTFF